MFGFLHSGTFKINFSNSLIIHAEKQRKLQPWRRFGYVILIIIKSGELLLWFSPRIINGLRSYIKHSKGCFIRYPNTLKLVKKNSAAPHFLNHFSVFGYRMKRSSSCLIYYIIHNFGNTASKWMLQIGQPWLGTSRGMLFHTALIFVVGVWDADLYRASKILMSANFMSANLFSSMISEKIIDLYGNVKMTIDILKGTKF